MAWQCYNNEYYNDVELFSKITTETMKQHFLHYFGYSG